MKTRKTKLPSAWLAFAWSSIALTGGSWLACTLNPQPIPPGDTAGRDRDSGIIIGGENSDRDAAADAGDAGDAGDGGCPGDGG